MASKKTVTLELECVQPKPHPLYQVTISGVGNNTTSPSRRYGEFKTFYDNVVQDLASQKLEDQLPEFPPRFAKSSLGIALSPDELKDRTNVRVSSFTLKFIMTS